MSSFVGWASVSGGRGAPRGCSQVRIADRQGPSAVAMTCLSVRWDTPPRHCFWTLKLPAPPIGHHSTDLRPDPDGTTERGGHHRTPHASPPCARRLSGSVRLRWWPGERRSRAGRKPGRCKWPLTRRNRLLASSMPGGAPAHRHVPVAPARWWSLECSRQMEDGGRRLDGAGGAQGAGQRRGEARARSTVNVWSMP